MNDSLRTDPAAAPPRAEGRRLLRALAMFEGLKGLAALAALLGLLDLMHRDVRRLAVELIGRFGLDPHAHYPSILLHYADLLPGANLHALELLAAGYITLRLLEAYGLWYGRSWGEQVAAVSGALYIPFEIRHLVERPTLSAGLVLAGNGFLVGYLVLALWRRRRASSLGGGADAARAASD